ncbi:MAG: bifunctional diguanylate cyclase/phosphodiesterase [Ruminococcus sp.]|uniref:putative bifunctional diguanylate cyclase/phosphodiesterase n=1 Tax=Ruminococcus sp. TaxID=41978 RepID=UPI001B6F4273|nr:bifunctional diguanylate cyclase/phosphodiesterase [Ruminococcus sp.]MBP5579357.1 bifunctional diguanylate cyclase/phosphodiesterase [Ruminococcus sp.]
MEKNNSGAVNKNILEKTIDSISEKENYSIVGYFIMLALYIAATIIIKLTSGSRATIEIGGSTVAISSFAGVFSALANIFIVLIVIYYRKLGYYTAIAALILQLPMILIDIPHHKNFSALPGLFTDLCTIIAVTTLHKKNERLHNYQLRIRDQAVTDMLTGLPNRFACSELIDNLIKRDERFAVVLIDLNNFKSINDTLGFDAGNKVLSEIASRWKNIADSGLSGTVDFINRLGGDEFSLVIRSYDSSDNILNTINKYENVLGQRMTIDGCDLYISASFGYAEFPADAKNFDRLLSYSDAAVSEMKRLGSGNHILHFTPDLLKPERTLEIERTLRTALDSDNIFFCLQPQFDISHKLRGFEALARVKDENSNILRPDEFIPVAERVGMIDKVEGEILKKSAVFFGDLIKKTGADIILSVNVSVKHLMKNGFIDELKDILEISGIPADQLELEITESVMIDSAEKSLHCIEEIKKMGIKIAIDDFGTGYSSLSYLNRLPADLLKIDKSFIDKMNTSDSSKQYVAAIISIGHIMGFEVISEGVEENDQLDSLHDIGCDFIQGFIWGHPLAVEDAERLVLESA